MNAPAVDLAVRLGRLELANPIMVASGTFGYAREMEGLVELARLGAVVPKTITPQPRAGNAPWRTVETAAGMLNSIGLDNDGIEAFIAHHLPFLAGLGVPIVVSIAAHDYDAFVAMADRLDGLGMALDFKKLKSALKGVLDRLDHKYINEVPPFDKENPTAENISRFIYIELSKAAKGLGVKVARVRVWESDNASAVYCE